MGDSIPSFYTASLPAADRGHTLVQHRPEVGRGEGGTRAQSTLYSTDWIVDTLAILGHSSPPCYSIEYFVAREQDSI